MESIVVNLLCIINLKCIYTSFSHTVMQGYLIRKIQEKEQALEWIRHCFITYGCLSGIRFLRSFVSNIFVVYTSQTACFLFIVIKHVLNIFLILHQISNKIILEVDEYVGTACQRKMIQCYLVFHIKSNNFLGN